MNSFWAGEQARQHIHQLHDEAAGGHLVRRERDAPEEDADATASSAAVMGDPAVHRLRGTLRRLRLALLRPSW
jgi:hypothetical protein